VEQLLDIVRGAAARGIGILCVTHRIDEIFNMASRVTVLRGGARLQRFLLRPWIGASSSGCSWAGELEEIRAASTALHAVAAEPVLQVQGLGAGLVAEASFAVRPGEIVGVAGPTGSGRETLLSAIFGAVERNAGAVTVAGADLRAMRPDLAMSLRVAFLPADRKAHAGIMDLTARENLTLPNLRPLWRAPRLLRGAERTEERSWFWPPLGPARRGPGTEAPRRCPRCWRSPCWSAYCRYF
jgi:ribose transport system ATP-binding protein